MVSKLLDTITRISTIKRKHNPYPDHVKFTKHGRMYVEPGYYFSSPKTLEQIRKMAEVDRMMKEKQNAEQKRYVHPALRDQFIQDEHKPEYVQDKFMLEFALDLCRILNEASITHEQLADRLGWSKRRMISVLKGRTVMTVSDMAKIATALGKSLSGSVFTEPLIESDILATNEQP